MQNTFKYEFSNNPLIVDELMNYLKTKFTLIEKFELKNFYIFIIENGKFEINIDLDLLNIYITFKVNTSPADIIEIVKNIETMFNFNFDAYDFHEYLDESVIKGEHKTIYGEDALMLNNIKLKNISYEKGFNDCMKQYEELKYLSELNTDNINFS